MTRTPVPREQFRQCQTPTPRRVVHSDGNDQSYIENLRRRKGPGADQPHRITYMKLVPA